MQVRPRLRQMHLRTDGERPATPTAKHMRHTLTNSSRSGARKAETTGAQKKNSLLFALLRERTASNACSGLTLYHPEKEKEERISQLVSSRNDVSLLQSQVQLLQEGVSIRTT